VWKPKKKKPPRVNYPVEYFWPAGTAKGKGWREARYCGLGDEGIGLLLGGNGARVEIYASNATCRLKMATCIIDYYLHLLRPH
jgi:hypothetical protein